MSDFEYELTKAIEERDIFRASKAILDKFPETDFLCDVILDVCLNLSSEDRVWMIEKLQRFTKV